MFQVSLEADAMFNDRQFQAREAPDAQLETELATLKGGSLPDGAAADEEGSSRPAQSHTDSPRSNPDLKSRHLEAKLAQSFNGVHVDDEDVEACWALFFRDYHPHLPIIEEGLSSVACRSHSRLLFWTIVMTGARRYSRDRAIFAALSPEVYEFAKVEVFAREGWPFLHTIMAILILCNWPAQFPTIDSDTSQVLAGAALGLAMRTGLHDAGNGQEFCRYRVSTQNTELLKARARVWSGLLVVYQHLSFAHGTPPITKQGIGYNNHLREVFEQIPDSLKFQDQLSNIQSEALTTLHWIRRDTPFKDQANAIDPLINRYLRLLDGLSSTTKVDTFFIKSASLQVCSYYLMCPRDTIQPSYLALLFDYACGAIEAADDLDRRNDFAKYAPLYVSYYVQNAAQFLIRLGHCKYSDSLNLVRGKRGIFNAIRLFRGMSLDGSDTHMRSAAVTSQLWSSSKLFLNKKGEVDGLAVRCSGRYAMSVAHDCWWRWRSEFAGLDDPFADTDPINPIGTEIYSKAPISTYTNMTPSVGPQSRVEGEGVYYGLEDIDFSAPEYQQLMQFDWTQLSGNPLEMEMDTASLPANFW